MANAKEAIEGFIEFLKKTGRPVPIEKRRYRKVVMLVRLPA
jgi:predicted RNase H-like HicB family nuclease